MDSAGWVLAVDLLNLIRHGEFGKEIQELDVHEDDLQIIAATAPKFRVQLGVVYINGKDKQQIACQFFIRANQGTSIPFIREDRAGKVFYDVHDCRDCIRDLWHSTDNNNLDSKLRNGLLPGGTGGERCSCYFSPLPPWEEGFRETSRSQTDTFIQVDVEKLFECVAQGTIVQTSNGSVLVRAPIVPTAFVCVMVERSKWHNRTPQLVWHRNVTNLTPTSAGPAIRTWNEWIWNGTRGLS